MMNVFFNEIDWKNIKFVGFDLDGTLYDEYEFIYQVYGEISKNLIEKGKNDLFRFMLSRWIETGSSYPYIFDEAYEKYKDLILFNKENFIINALKIYRNYVPSLFLSARVKTILDYCKKNYCVFLITDGHPKLQKNKFFALRLYKYFDLSNVFFTGIYGKEYYKPNNKILELFNFDIDVTKTVYFGDREQDKLFARKSNIYFIKVYNMLKKVEK